MRAAIFTRALGDDSHAVLISDTQSEAQACCAAAYDQYIVLVGQGHDFYSLRLIWL
jgi:hypothetical protein